MKVVLSGYYGFDNVGDEAILFSIIAALRKIQPDIEITVLSNNPEYTSSTYRVGAVNRWSLKKVVEEIKGCDGLISGGGSLLQDKTGNRSVIYYSGVMLIAKLLGKPFVVYAQGIGPIEQKKNQRITKFALSKAALLTVRDAESKRFLEEIGVSLEIKLVPDPVLGIEIDAARSSDGVDGDDKGVDGRCQWLSKVTEDQAPSGDHAIDHHSHKFISVSVRDWPSDVPFLENIAGTLDKLSRLGYEIIFLPMHGEHDEKTSKNVQAMMTERTMVAPGDLSIEEKIRLIGESELLIGMRLHALIFAAVMATPFTAISYDPKIDAFADLCQQPIAAHVNEPGWSEESLFQVVHGQLSNLPQYREKLLDYTKNAKSDAQKTATLTISTFNK